MRDPASVGFPVIIVFPSLESLYLRFKKLLVTQVFEIWRDAENYDGCCMLLSREFCLMSVAPGFLL